MRLLLDGGETEFIVEDKGKDGFRIAVFGSYINYDKTYHFCSDDEKYIAVTLKKFLNDEIKEVTVEGTTDPNLSLMLCPKGVRAWREESETGKETERFYDYKFIKIELDLVVAGSYGIQFWSEYLSEEESIEFCQQWLDTIYNPKE